MAADQGVHRLMAERLYVADVQADDLILWASRVAEVTEIRPVEKPLKRAARYLVLDVGGGDVRACHYWDDEVVVLHSRPATHRAERESDATHSGRNEAS